MEVKLSTRHRPPDLRPPELRRSLFRSSPNLPFYSFCPKSWENGEWSFQKRLRGTVKKWRLRLQEVSSCQCSVNHSAVHVVKENETLTSISKQYGVSIYAIAAANKNVADMDLVYKGQHLNIPLATKGTKVGEKNWSTMFRLPERKLGSFNLSNVPKNFSILCPHFDSHVYSSKYQARSVGYIIVLVPLITFCIKCIAGAIHARASRKLREETPNDSDIKHHRSGSGRWKSALGDAWGPDLMDTKSSPDSREIKEVAGFMVIDFEWPLQNHSEDEAHISHEEESRAYEKLERDYQEFLSKCGMSKFGYWRGGTSR